MTNENTHPTSYKDATGPLPYGLMNDYMFHVVFQKNLYALKGLISSVLHMNPDDIKNVIITNPIKLGEQIDDKTFILDIEVLLNNDHLLNLEMQVANQFNWQDRSLSYLCRSFDQLYQSEEYTEAKPVTHIGFLNFTPFPEFPEFNAHYKFMNIKNHMIYSDKLTINVINLTHIELATEEDKVYNIDYWARLFTASSWEDIKMIADNNTYLESASQTMYELSGDELVERQCRARRDYYKQVNTYNRAMQELEAANQTIDEQNQTINAQTQTIDAQTQTIDAQTQTIDAQTQTIDEQTSALAQKDLTIEQLQKRIAELEAQRTANS